jgi:hypothetical protein
MSISGGKRANNSIKFGVAILSALLGVIPRSGVSNTLPRTGVPAAEGELARKRGLAAGHRLLCALITHLNIIQLRGQKIERRRRGHGRLSEDLNLITKWTRGVATLSANSDPCARRSSADVVLQIFPMNLDMRIEQYGF